jgi:hypothetical protein
MSEELERWLVEMERLIRLELMKSQPWVAESKAWKLVLSDSGKKELGLADAEEKKP